MRLLHREKGAKNCRALSQISTRFGTPHLSHIEHLLNISTAGAHWNIISLDWFCLGKIWTPETNLNPRFSHEDPMGLSGSNFPTTPMMTPMCPNIPRHLQSPPGVRIAILAKHRGCKGATPNSEGVNHQNSTYGKFNRKITCHMESPFLESTISTINWHKLSATWSPNHARVLDLSYPLLNAEVIPPQKKKRE